MNAGPVARALRQAPSADTHSGGHPLAGREGSGPLAARADLSANRSRVLTPVPDASREALDRAREPTAMCGAAPVLMSNKAHDQPVALTSRAPHVMAGLMAARLNNGPADTVHLAGRGLRDTTRIAAGDPRLWTDTLRSRAGPVAGVLAGTRDGLTALVAALEGLDSGPAPAEASHDAVVSESSSSGVAGLGGVRPREDVPSAGRARVTVEVGETRRSGADAGDPRRPRRRFGRRRRPSGGRRHPRRVGRRAHCGRT
ncbi:prephenate dehydrogenase/arogenate dehydrogenase family protein [Streptomyces sp. MRC013]|uniref:prephenate dehydrogenase/arogenate dehydrogenase family protein n=1 Tax=Streptomyces sp. MRC013 TaxID=2898276 RepID=UPI0032EA0A2C